MKCIIIAAGYATRLYPLTENFPKPLLKIKNKSILDWLIDDLGNRVDKYYVVTNHKYYNHFIEWSKDRDNIEIIDDGTSTNETRLGAIKDIELAIENKNIDEDCLIMAGDTVLDFSLNKFLDYCLNKKTTCVMRYELNDINKLRHFGVANIDKNDVITAMEEKSQTPKYNNVIPPFYYVIKDDLKLYKTCIEDGCNTDAPGSFITWLINKSPVHAYLMPGQRYDVGDLETYNNINNTYQGIIY